jgi:hypothetical protein
MFWKSKSKKVAEQLLQHFEWDMRDVMSLPPDVQRGIAEHVRARIDHIEKTGQSLSPEAWSDSARQLLVEAVRNRQGAVGRASASGGEGRDPNWAKYALEEDYLNAFMMIPKHAEPFQYIHTKLVRWSDELKS